MSLKQIWQAANPKGHLLTAISFLIPIVCGSGFIIAIGMGLGGTVQDTLTPGQFDVWQAMATLGAKALGLLPVVIAVGISGSIAGKPGIAPGFVVGLAANTISAGFIGGMIGGYIAGYIALAIIKNVKVPDWARGLMPTLIVPFFASIISCLIMVYIIGTPIGIFTEALTSFENLKKTADENIRALDDWPSTITLRQTIDELLEIGMVKNNMPDTMRDYVSAQKALVEASRSREATLGRFRTLLEAQLGSSHQQMQMFNQRMAQIVRVSGGLILVATLLALLLAWGLNHYFIRSRLVKRFTALNQAVVQIGLGRTEATIPVYGRDELGRIAGLLRHTLGQLNAQKQQLEQEIGERKAIEADLRATQDELIQTAKLAVVGQTMTTLAHEINQPLNALSMYLFTAGRAIEQGQAEQARTTLSKAEGLINRIDAIIRSLRQFTRRAELETPLHPVDLRQTFTVAWELLAMRHKPQQGTLVIPDDTVWIQGDEVRVHQVLVNVLSNALDACPHAAQITVSWQIQGGRLCVLIADNGPGWPAALLPSLLKPFTTSKTVGLGIGLSICVSLMTQMEGALRLASTFTRSACVVLEFNLTDVKDVE